MLVLVHERSMCKGTRWGESVRLEEDQGSQCGHSSLRETENAGQKGQWGSVAEGLFRASKAGVRPLHLLLSERAPLEGVQQSSHNLRVAFQLPCGAQENRTLTKRSG